MKAPGLKLLLVLPLICFAMGTKAQDTAKPRSDSLLYESKGYEIVRVYLCDSSTYPERDNKSKWFLKVDITLVKVLRECELCGYVIFINDRKADETFVSTDNLNMKGYFYGELPKGLAMVKSNTGELLLATPIEVPEAIVKLNAR